MTFKTRLGVHRTSFTAPSEHKMVHLAVISFLLLLGVPSSIGIVDEDRVVCYFAGFASQRKVENRLTPIDLDPGLCTHIIYASAYPNFDYGIVPANFERDVLQGYKELSALKEVNPKLLTLLSIEGIYQRSMELSNIASDEAGRSVFMQYVANFLRKYNFDGLDVDWQYPGEVGRHYDRVNYAKLISELRRKFEQEAQETKRPRLLISLAVPQKKAYIRAGYNLTSLNQNVDFFNVLSMDYHTSRESKLNHPAPLYTFPFDDENKELNVDFTINYYLDQGVDPSKINLGIPTYGTTFLLKSSTESDLGSPTRQKGLRHINIRETLPYFEICKYVLNKGRGVWTVEHPNNTLMGPYAYYADVWIGFDDEIIVRNKAMYAKDHHLGGIVFWTIDQDDIHGECEEKYSLIKSGKKALLEYSGRPEDRRPQEGVTEVENPATVVYGPPFEEVDYHEGNGGFEEESIEKPSGGEYHNSEGGNTVRPTVEVEETHPTHPTSMPFTSIPVESGFLKPITEASPTDDIVVVDLQHLSGEKRPLEGLPDEKPIPVLPVNSIGDLDSAGTGSGNRPTTYRPSHSTQFTDFMVEEDTEVPLFYDKTLTSTTTFKPSPSPPAFPDFMTEEDTETPFFSEKPVVVPQRQRTRRPSTTQQPPYDHTRRPTRPSNTRRRTTIPPTHFFTESPEVPSSTPQTHSSNHLNILNNTQPLLESTYNNALDLASAFLPNSPEKTLTNLTILNFLTPLLNRGDGQKSTNLNLPDIRVNTTLLPSANLSASDAFPNFGFKEINSKRDVILQNVLIFVTNHHYYNSTDKNSTSVN